jgi:hypothetical protein
MTILNPAIDFKTKQGLTKEWYEGVVVDNNDPMKLARVRIKVEEVFGDIKDEHLPWAIPEYSFQADGASANSGSFIVPKVKTKIRVRFQNCDPLLPVYAAYMVDKKTALKEAEHNYPNRMVHLFSTGALLIVDTKSNEVFLRNPGDLNIYILGDVNLMVNGDVTEKINGNKTSVIKGDSLEIVEGNKTIQVKGDYAEVVDGSRLQYTEGDDSVAVNGSSNTNISGDRTVSSANDTQIASGNALRFGAIVHDNPPGGGASSPVSKPEVPDVPKFKTWPGIRGKKPDSDSDAATS